MTRIDVTRIEVKRRDLVEAGVDLGVVEGEQERDARYEEMLAREYGWE